MDNKILRTPICKLEEVPHEICGVKLSEKDRVSLHNGGSSSLLKGLKLKDHPDRTAKITFRHNGNNELVVHFDFKMKSLKFDNNEFGVDLSKEDIKKLKDGETLGPFDLNGNDQYLKVDKELKAVRMCDRHEVGIPESIGGYFLTFEDKSKLANGEALIDKPLVDPEGNFFKATIEPNHESNSLGVRDLESLTLDNYQSLVQKDKESRNLLSFPGLNDTEQRAYHLVQIGDLKEMSELKIEKASTELESAIVSLNHVDEKTRIAALTILGIQNAAQKVKQLDAEADIKQDHIPGTRRKMVHNTVKSAEHAASKLTSNM
jgi:hypothetical protein